MLHFTADWHLYHDNIIELVGRPFRTAHNMMKCYVRNYREYVMPDDTCYFIGDFLWGRSVHNLELVLSKLPGKKILILGNHDIIKPFDYIEAGFHSVHTSLKFETHYNKYVLVHDPAAAVMCRSRVCLSGHVHDLFLSQGNALNVGVDVHEHRPISIMEVEGWFVPSMKFGD